MSLSRRLPLLLLLSACVTEHPASVVPKPPRIEAPAAGPIAPPAGSAGNAAPPVQTLAQQVERGSALMSKREFQQADVIFRSVLASPGFASLDTAHQHTTLLFSGANALWLGDPQRGLSLAKRACLLPQAGGLDWRLRVRAANAAGDPRDAALALTTLAQHWPEMVSQMQEYEDLATAMPALDDYGSDTDRYLVLTALFKTYFPEEPDEASTWWRDLALLQLTRGGHTVALDTLARVTDAYVAISIEADGRFDPIRGEIEQRLNVTEIAARTIASSTRRVQRNPDKLEPVVHLARLLNQSLRFEQTLKVVEAALDQQDAQGPTAFTDHDRWYVWLLQHRADALFGLARWDAAVAQLQSAAALPQQGGPNVDQVINLASMYTRLARPHDALATLQKLEPKSANPYGDMVADIVRLDALLQLQDRNGVHDALGFLRQHCNDALDVCQEGLLLADRRDEAARLLISRLAHPRQRSQALVSVQRYLTGNSAREWAQKEDRDWRTLIERRDVQQAIRRVGHVGSYALDQPNY
ncbi:MAG TPA: hypothetical protein VGP32_11715 [Steroidobacteraceae bacterium]|nr:hypothetical protein [Steroidobacteraceae bacterium]